VAEVFKIGITQNNNKNIEEVNSVELIANKGIVGDRYFKDFSDPISQLTLIESENIDDYNKRYNLNIDYLDFRRNIVTKDIKLNDYIDKKILIGKVEVEVIDLCRPCRFLQEKLNKNNIIKEFLRKGGLRCRILSSGNIKVGDLIA
jgi:MOSC domain-containing protein YiiM|tara:strand:- start:642 stop:1079 length:438 start_codon:yes stop_codon:yes gene_type:complete